MRNALEAAVARADSRQRRLRSLAAYPLAMAVVSVALAAGFLGAVRPTFDYLLRHDPDLGAGPGAGPLLIAVGLAVLCLCYLALVLWSGRAIFPVRKAREAADRVVVVSGAAHALGEGGELVEALRGAAEHARIPRVREATCELAAALQRGEAGGEGLLGASTTACLAAAAGRGEAEAVLGDLADLLEVEIEQRLPLTLMRVELMTLTLAGIALGSVAVTLYQLYLSLFLPA